MARDENGRPGKGGPMSSTAIVDVSDDTSPRCQICSSRIYAVESIRTGLGRDCRRRLTAMLTTGAQVQEDVPHKPVRTVPSASQTRDDLDLIRAAVVALRAAADALAAVGGVR